MLVYILKRLLGMVPLLLGITLLSFLVMQLVPGDPGGVATDLNPKVAPEMLAQLREHYGLNAPVHEQYLNWLWKLLQLDFGQSFQPGGGDVLTMILAALPITLAMNVVGLVVILLLAIPIGIASARWQNGMFDRTSTVLLFIGFAAPSFWLGLMAMQFFGVQLGWFPISGTHSFGSENWDFYWQWLDVAHHLFLPITIGVVGALAGMSRYMRSTMLEVIRQDYITTARAKGAPENTVLWRHALPNALMPVITILGLSLPTLIGGSVIMESLFAIPGMGKLFYDGVLMRDYPLIMGILTLGAVLTLLGNLLADVGYALVDPRVRTGG